MPSLQAVSRSQRVSQQYVQTSENQENLQILSNRQENPNYSTLIGDESNKGAQGGSVSMKETIESYRRTKNMLKDLLATNLNKLQPSGSNVRLAMHGSKAENLSNRGTGESSGTLQGR